MSLISIDDVIKYIMSVFLPVQERQCFRESFKYDFVSSLWRGQRLRFLLVLYSASLSSASSTRRGAASLGCTNQTIEMSAANVGFSSVYAFSHAFLPYSGQRPGRWRRKMAH